MRHFLLYILAIGLFSCGSETNSSKINPVKWSERKTELPSNKEFEKGTTYLAVSSEIYSQNEHKRHDLTATVSMRNLNERDTVFFTNAKYYNTAGKLIREYFNFPVFIAPMETLEIVIAENDPAGGTGGNFIFHWLTPKGKLEPLVDAIMISTSGQQGLSFTSTGKRIK